MSRHTAEEQGLLDVLKDMAEQRGIKTCHTKVCDQVACYRVIWLGRELYYCEGCTNGWEAIAKCMGMGAPKTRITLPPCPGGSKRFAAIGADIINEGVSPATQEQ